MHKKSSQIMALFLCCILLVVTFSGCIENEQKSKKSKEASISEINLDQPSILPDWKDGEYHDYYGTIDLLNEFQIKYPDLVNVFSIGKSVLGKDIWCIRITNEKNAKQKSSCLIDGCIHGNEWEGGEACLYLAEYLLINFDHNETITNILNTSEVYLVPLVNPDGRQANTRWNDNGIDLNRNYDVDFGRLRGMVLPIGKLFGFIKIPFIDLSNVHYYLFSNCGRHPFSEPESQALREFMMDIENNDFSFYVNCHTATHDVGIPWSVFKHPFEMTEQETNLFDYVLNWVGKNTEYEPSPVLIDSVSGKKIYQSGYASDWSFKEFRIPSFAFEILSPDYEPYLGEGIHDHLVHWMNTTLPFFMYLLVNIDNLREWKTPDIQPSLPDGVPPEPLQKAWSTKSGLTFNITGGRGVKLKITNNGKENAYGVPWQIHLEGGIFGRIDKTVADTIDIPAGESKTVRTGNYFGVGELKITISVDEANRIAWAEKYLIFTKIWY